MHSLKNFWLSGLMSVFCLWTFAGCSTSRAGDASDDTKASGVRDQDPGSDGGTATGDIHNGEDKDGENESVASEGEGEGEQGGEGEGEGESEEDDVDPQNPMDVPCVGDSDCVAGEVCGFDTRAGFVRTLCQAPRAGQSPATFCDNNVDCDRGLCLGGQCTVPCARPEDCVGETMCSTVSVTIDGAGGVVDVCDFDAAQTLLPCSSDSTCAALFGLCNDLVGSDVNALTFACGPAGTGAEFGEACASPYLEATDVCRTGLCDHTVAGVCTRVCAADEECGGSGYFCTGSGLSNVDDRLCARACSRNADCSEQGRTCQLRENLVEQKNDLACTAAPGELETGALTTVSLQCRSNFVLQQTIDTVATAFCTEFCVEDQDCPQAKPRCRDVDVPKPGAGTQRMRLCAD